MSEQPVNKRLILTSFIRQYNFKIILYTLLILSSRRIFVARVLKGFYQLGTSSHKHPDPQQSGDPYDATVDNITNPTIFVIYRDSRAYPLYLYVFS